MIAQAIIKGKVIEKRTGMPIPFASVVYQKQLIQKGVISDIHGEFVIQEENVRDVTVTCIGYKPVKTKITTAGTVVEMENEAVEMSEVVIKPSANPAIRIIKQVLANKKFNNFENYDAYSYRCYFKTVFDVKSANNATSADSVELNKNRRLKKQAFLISESVVSCLHIQNATENKIIATKTSGFNGSGLGQDLFVVFHNSISFYNNSISLFEVPLSTDKSLTDYVSPLSDGCLGSYNYQLDETYNNTADSIFVINFFPKRGKKFNSLTGKLFISSNGYAIKNVVAEPYQKGLIDFKFRQDYEYIRNKWFPVKLDEEIGFAYMKIKGIKNSYPVYLVTSNIDSVDYRSPANRHTVHLEKVYQDRKSIMKSDSILKTSRLDTLTLREKNTYHALDSLGRKHNFDNKLNFITKLAFGKIALKYSDLDLNRVYSYNEYEGSRLGIGLNSNEEVTKFFSLGGFVGYGSRDKQLKYGARWVLDLNKYNEVQLSLSYQNNLKEAGLEVINDYSALSFSDYLRSNIGSRFDQIVEKRMEFGFRAFRYLKVLTSLSVKEVNPTYTYNFKGTGLTNYESDDAQITLKYAYGEELMTINDQRVSNTDGNPIINVTYRRGIGLLSSRSFQYNRIETTVDVTAYKGNIGQSDIRLAAGWIDRSLPYGLLFTGEGSKNTEIPLIITNSFQTMLPNEFLSDRYIHLFCSHNFGNLVINTPRFKPQFILVHNCGWGALANASDQGIDFREKNKVYLESGMIINDLLKIKYFDMFYLGFGMGAFYRYGYYGSDRVQDNLALKLSASISFK